MTREELIAKGKHKVRGNSDLMRIYISLFYEKFGYKPDCAGCTFEKDWKKFVSSEGHKVTSNIASKMDITFRLKRNTSDILAYKKDGKTYRSYANKATEQFMKDFLAYGTPEQIKEREKLFAVLPKIQEEPTAKPKRTLKKK